MPCRRARDAGDCGVAARASSVDSVLRSRFFRTRILDLPRTSSSRWAAERRGAARRSAARRRAARVRRHARAQDTTRNAAVCARGRDVDRARRRAGLRAARQRIAFERRETDGRAIESGNLVKRVGDGSAAASRRLRHRRDRIRRQRDHGRRLSARAHERQRETSRAVGSVSRRAARDRRRRSIVRIRRSRNGICPACSRCAAITCGAVATIDDTPASIENLWVDVGARSRAEAERMGIDHARPGRARLAGVDVQRLRRRTGGGEPRRMRRGRRRRQRRRRAGERRDGLHHLGRRSRSAGPGSPARSRDSAAWTRCTIVDGELGARCGRRLASVRAPWPPLAGLDVGADHGDRRADAIQRARWPSRCARATSQALHSRGRSRGRPSNAARRAPIAARARLGACAAGHHSRFVVALRGCARQADRHLRGVGTRAADARRRSSRCCPAWARDSARRRHGGQSRAGDGSGSRHDGLRRAHGRDRLRRHAHRSATARSRCDRAERSFRFCGKGSRRCSIAPTTDPRRATASSAAMPARAGSAARRVHAARQLARARAERRHGVVRAATPRAARERGRATSVSRSRATSARRAWATSRLTATLDRRSRRR